MDIEKLTNKLASDAFELRTAYGDGADLMNYTSWIDQVGILITGEEAEFLVGVLKNQMKIMDGFKT